MVPGVVRPEWQSGNKHKKIHGPFGLKKIPEPDPLDLLATLRLQRQPAAWVVPAL